MTEGNEDILQKKKKVLITSALPYVNNVPHLGNIIGCVLSADVFARFCRSYGCETIFICGTDEHGTTTEVKAIEEGITPKEVCDKYFIIHKEVYEWFNCSFDKFGRSSSKTNYEISIDIFKKLDQNGYILEDELEQMYDSKAKKFLADRFVEGTCPKCSFESARGDQCDNCGSLLDPTDLKNPVSKLTGEKPVIKKEKHLFVDLPKLSTDLKKWINSEKKNWSKNAVSMTESWLKTGLKPRCITRDLKWGVPVPKKGYEHKVFYSWFDAPIAYISITKEATKNWQKWWHNPNEVQLYQFMGKDNIPFHTIMFPSFLIGAKDNYTLLHQISSTEYLNYEDSQFSKSRGVGVFGNQVMETGIPADIWRYYLLINRPETADTEFRWDDFQARNNNELLANFGNFVNRILTFLDKNYDGIIPKAKRDEKFVLECKKKLNKIANLLSKISLREGLQEVMLLSRLGNQYFQEKKPWEAKNDTVMLECVNLVRKLAIVIEAYLPETSQTIFSLLKLKKQTWENLDDDVQNHKIAKPKMLFRKLEDEEIQKLKEKYEGKTQPFPLDLRIAEITDVKLHPNADKLYLLTLSLGKEKRQIVSGLRPYYEMSDLKGKRIVLVHNLKPAKLKGEISQGMLLAGENKNKVVVLEAPEANPGDRVNPEGLECLSKEVNIEEFVKLGLKVKDKKAWFKNRKLVFKTGEVSVDLPNGSKIS